MIIYFLTTFMTPVMQLLLQLSTDGGLSHGDKQTSKVINRPHVCEHIVLIQPLADPGRGVNSLIKQF